ncbi:MAG: PepSY domain-containing protein [Gammaproteobacteria bacterium]|jgi:hypothetical protein|nr:PepSY domain-containing protein [Gammaproteobacteria bacterium]MBT5204582.1 PepSY domain-containing protein [Gammaproteobacteria bacterium]MBT5602887.1 PepSY domain-containing protein [Gammaproteobacteria bacterium]MBT6244718.1 PepSY domain-containing protein [Gammaproteobacteria bacterium]
MKLTKKNYLRQMHRWLGLIAGIQLLLWTVSGLYFTLIPIEEIRGDHLRLEPEATPVTNHQWLSPSQVLNLHPDLNTKTSQEIRLSHTDGHPIYLIGSVRLDALTGKKLDTVSKQQALDIVQARAKGRITGIDLVQSVDSDSEYRGRELPAWRVTIDQEEAHFYVGAGSGRLLAVRTNAWRWFDFLWALHIMDYENRDNFNHLLVQVLAVLSAITVLSGLALFVVTLRARGQTAG